MFKSFDDFLRAKGKTPDRSNDQLLALKVILSHVVEKTLPGATLGSVLTCKSEDKNNLVRHKEIIAGARREYGPMIQAFDKYWTAFYNSCGEELDNNNENEPSKSAI